MIINVNDFCKSENASLGIEKAIAACSAGDTLSFPKGDCHFYREYSPSETIHMTNTDSFRFPDKHFAMLLKNKSNLTIDGGGAVFNIHGDMCALGLLNCKNITLKNFTVRYPSPSNIEFKVCEASGNSVIYQLSASEFKTDGKSITFFEKSPFSNTEYFSFTGNQMTDCWVCHDDDEVYRVWNQNSPLSRVKTINRLTDNIIEIKYYFKPDLKRGAVYTISPNHSRHTSGIFFSGSSNIKSENITVNYLAGFGWLSQMCENLSFDGIRFQPAAGHSVSSFADGIHICGCKGRVTIKNCLFSHLHDDGINIHGAFLRTKKTLNVNTAVFEFVHNQQGGYEPFFAGDKVKFYNRKDLSLIGENAVKSVQNDINNKCVTLEFEEPLPPLKVGMSVIENVSYNPEVVISDCAFKAIPTRGILCTTDKRAEIFNNSFEHIQMACIYISCDCKEWYESGPCRNVEIHNNTFYNKDYALCVEPIALDRVHEGVHQNIRFYSNALADTSKAVKATGVKNLLNNENREL